MAQRDLIAIGGSTGSIEPLRMFLRSLPSDFPAAIAVTLHIASTSTGIFTTIASASADLAVVTATEGEELLPGKVYLAPPDRHLMVLEGRCRLGAGPRENFVRPSIDPLMRSVAISHGPRAIGIILSGMLNDGADGLRAIKRCGGLAMVQSPVDCIASDMPLAALEATSVDLSAHPDELAAACLRYVGQNVGASAPAPNDILLDVEIALGQSVGSDRLRQIAVPSTLTCPSCNGVMSEIRHSQPLRFRCQVGHGYTAKVLAEHKEDAVDEAMRVALRIVEERAELVSRMGRDAQQAGRGAVADMYQQRASEYHQYADTIRQAVISLMHRARNQDDG